MLLAKAGPQINPPPESRTSRLSIILFGEKNNNSNIKKQIPPNFTEAADNLWRVPVANVPAEILHYSTTYKQALEQYCKRILCHSRRGRV